MRVALIAVVAALAVGLFLVLSLGREPEPEIAAKSAAAPELPAADAVAEPAPELAVSGPEPGSELGKPTDVASAPAPREPAADPEQVALAERYQAAAIAARARVATLAPPPRPSKPVNPLSQPFDRPDPDGPSLRAWQEYIAPLLYPPGHPQEGQPLDSTTAPALAAAADDLVRSLYPPEMLDQPRREIRLQLTFFEVQKLQREFGLGREFADAVAERPADPSAPLYDPYFVNTDPDDPLATTMAEYYAQQNQELAAEFLGQSPANE